MSSVLGQISPVVKSLLLTGKDGVNLTPVTLPPHFAANREIMAVMVRGQIGRGDGRVLRTQIMDHPLLSQCEQVLMDRSRYFPIWLDRLMAAAALWAFEDKGAIGERFRAPRSLGDEAIPYEAIRLMVHVSAELRGFRFGRLSDLTQKGGLLPQKTFYRLMAEGYLFEDDLITRTNQYVHGPLSNAIQVLADASQIDPELGPGKTLEFYRLMGRETRAHHLWDHWYEQQAGLSLANLAFVQELLEIYLHPERYVFSPAFN